jgi:hypothetical protein
VGLPKTYLMTVPVGESNPFGQSIQSDELVRGLRCINPAIHAWEEHSGIWYPGKGRINCLWLGDPGGKGRKIAAYPLGPIPEFTQIAPDSDEIMLMGWRQIFEDVIASGAASKGAIERQFKVDLTIDQKDLACDQCRRFGTVRQADIDGLCRAHWSAREIAKRMRTAS